MNDVIEFARKVRCDILKQIHTAKSGHPGGSLSSVEILSILYNKVLNVPREWTGSLDFYQRDRFILSKGHASPLLYATLANAGFFDKSLLSTFRKINSRLQGHPCLKTKLPGIEMTTGSLGQGLSVGVGMALGLKLDKINSKVFVLMGDGELQEGSVWEAFMQAGHRKLDNIIAIIDRNKLQIDGCTKDVTDIEPLADKLRAFNFDVVEVDGHNLYELSDAFLFARNSKKPCAIIANTIKGKGVSFMENNPAWHGKVPSDDELKLALEEINAK